MFTIYIEQLEFECIVGILDFERETPQKVCIDAVIAYDFDCGFIDYAKVVKIIKKSMIKRKFYLLEDAQRFLAKKLKKKFPQIHFLKIKIVKPAILPECRVGIELESRFDS